MTFLGEPAFEGGGLRHGELWREVAQVVDINFEDFEKRSGEVEREADSVLDQVGVWLEVGRSRKGEWLIDIPVILRWSVVTPACC